MDQNILQWFWVMTHQTKSFGISGNTEQFSLQMWSVKDRNFSHCKTVWRPQHTIVELVRQWRYTAYLSFDQVIICVFFWLDIQINNIKILSNRRLTITRLQNFNNKDSQTWLFVNFWHIVAMETEDISLANRNAAVHEN